MSVRENIIREIHRRLRLVPDVVTVLRNPKLPPTVEQLQDGKVISFFYADDIVLRPDHTGDYPDLIREWEFIVIPYMLGSDDYDDEAAETEINDFLDLVRTELYRNGPTLDNTCSFISEKSTGGLIKPHVGKPGIGIPMTWAILYQESTGNLFSS